MSNQMTEASCPCCGGKMVVVRETATGLLLRCSSCSMSDLRLKV